VSVNASAWTCACGVLTAPIAPWRFCLRR
jgi:hypothetical protein